MHLRVMGELFLESTLIKKFKNLFNKKNTRDDTTHLLLYFQWNIMA